MATGSGISAQLGVAEEVTWGTLVTPQTRFFEFRSESIKATPARLESKAIRSGQRVQQSADWAAGAITVGGDIELDLMTLNTALLFKHAMGTVATTSTGGAAPYTHTCTPGDLTGKGLTVQVGRPDSGGTVRPFTYSGCKVGAWEVACSAPGDIAKFKVSVMGKAESTGSLLTTASYTASNTLYTFTHGSAQIAGTTSNVRSFTLSGDNKLNASRFYLGQNTTSEPLESAYREYKGTLEMDFEDMTQLNRFINGTEAAVVLRFMSGSNSVTFTLNARFDGETPTIGDQDITKLSLPIKCVATAADSTAITVAVVSTEATP